MPFWNTTMQFFWREESWPVLVMTLCVAFLLFHFLKEERKSILNTLTFFFACLALQFVSNLAPPPQYSTKPD